MKRALILVVAISMILTGCFMPEENVTNEVSAGSHYVKGTVVAVEACYRGMESNSSTCVGVVDQNDQKRAGKLIGDVTVGSTVYKECTVSNEVTTCSQSWHTSVGEVYLHGGEIVN